MEDTDNGERLFMYGSREYREKICSFAFNFAVNLKLL